MVGLDQNAIASTHIKSVGCGRVEIATAGISPNESTIVVGIGLIASSKAEMSSGHIKLSTWYGGREATCGVAGAAPHCSVVVICGVVVTTTYRSGKAACDVNVTATHCGLKLACGVAIATTHRSVIAACCVIESATHCGVKAACCVAVTTAHRSVRPLAVLRKPPPTVADDSS